SISPADGMRVKFACCAAGLLGCGDARGIDVGEAEVEIPAPIDEVNPAPLARLPAVFLRAQRPARGSASLLIGAYVAGFIFALDCRGELSSPAWPPRALGASFLGARAARATRSVRNVERAPPRRAAFPANPGADTGARPHPAGDGYARHR